MFNRVCYLFTQVRHLHDRKLPSVWNVTTTTKYVAYNDFPGLLISSIPRKLFSSFYYFTLSLSLILSPTFL